MTSTTSPEVAELLRQLAIANSQLDDERAQREAQAKLLEDITKLNRPTTLLEMLEECHNHFHRRFKVETESARTTRGSITKPEGRKCPAILQPWLEFNNLQSVAFQAARNQLHPASHEARRVFKSVTTIKELGEDLAGRTIASEEDLKAFQNRFVDPFIANICTALGSDVSFANTSHVLRPSPDNDFEARQALQSIDNPRPAPKPVNADQFCVHVDVGGGTKLLLVVELKAPHKLTEKSLRAVLGESGTIDVIQVRDAHEIPIEDDPKFLHHARRLVAAAATQAYDYMLDIGCLYGCIVTGEAMVFLKIGEEDTTVLYYHFAEPILEVTVNDGQSFQHSKTSIAQLATFCLMARDFIPQSQDWIRAANDAAPVWEVNYDRVYEETPQRRRDLLKKLDGKDRSYPGSKVFDSNRSPIQTRKIKQQQSCKPATTDAARSSQDSDDGRQDGPDCSAPPKGLTTSKETSHAQQGKKPSHKTSSAGKQQQQQQQHQRPYCTQSCLLGLVQRYEIDEACPNASLHPRGKQGNSHSLTKGKLGELLREQLARTMDQDCENLRLQGARGMLFKLSLASHGYTFVGKATIDYFIPELSHEGRVYQRLRKLQGHLIPVYLGNIDLDIPWYGPGVHLVHMLLMSYCGEFVQDSIDDQEQQQKHFQTAIAAFGVRHGDMRFPNMLWNGELGRLMFIDFERSTIDDRRKSLVPKAPKPKANDPRHATPKEFRPKISGLPIPKTRPAKRKALGNLSPFHGRLNRTTTMQRQSTTETSVPSFRDRSDIKDNSHLKEDNQEAPIVYTSAAK
ncbi:MAG: hypothetical protein Q9225_007683 [Loekoesia sp. 1 TL-2023]